MAELRKVSSIHVYSERTYELITSTHKNMAIAVTIK